MLILRFRRHTRIVLAIIAADIIIGLWFGERLVRWELEQLQEAWRGQAE